MEKKSFISVEKDILLLQETDVFANSEDLAVVIHSLENGYHQSVDDDGKKRICFYKLIDFEIVDMLLANEALRSKHKLFEGEKFWCYDQDDVLRPALIVEGELKFLEEANEDCAVYYVEYRGK